MIMNIIAVSNATVSEINHNIIFGFFFCDTQIVIVKHMLAVFNIIGRFWHWMMNMNKKWWYEIDLCELNKLTIIIALFFIDIDVSIRPNNYVKVWRRFYISSVSHLDISTLQET